jgi:hypothetical protein
MHPTYNSSPAHCLKKTAKENVHILKIIIVKFYRPAMNSNTETAQTSVTEATILNSPEILF